MKQISLSEQKFVQIGCAECIRFDGRGNICVSIQFALTDYDFASLHRVK